MGLLMKNGGAGLMFSMLTLVMIGWAATAEAKVRIYPRVHVDIWNRMTPGTELSMHCKSKDDDLGELGAGTDVAISFDFSPNVLDSTLFHCEGRSKFGVARFTAYQSDRDFVDRCRRLCTWNVRDDGVHGVDQSTNSEDLFIPWAPSS